MPITVSGTTITFNNGTTQTSAGGSGTVTSVATGNGLSGGTITSSGTLTIACPSFNSVGSYCQAFSTGSTVSSGSDYAAGTGSAQIQSLARHNNDGRVRYNLNNSTLSGTWRWMGGTASGQNGAQLGSACRVS
jgi:hypothetical protein